MIVIVVASVAALFTYSSMQAPSSDCTSIWECGAPYPFQSSGNSGVAGAQCLANSTEVFCVGGVDPSGNPRSNVYLGSISSSGNLSGWNPTSSYPIGVTGESCGVWAGRVYCVGGIHDSNGDDVASSYFAPLSSSGVGSWNTTTSYPIPVDSESCVTSNGYIYCIAGNNETSGNNANLVPSDSVWYAELSPTGIGTWAETSPYPAGEYVPACFTNAGFVFCVGGADPDGNPVSTAYFAPLSSAGVGNWTRTTGYPVGSTGLACAVSGGLVYCVGGETSGGETPAFTNSVYFAPVSAAGIGAWKQAPAFTRDAGTSCVASSGDIYCVGGFDESPLGEDNVVNYASLASLSG